MRGGKTRETSGERRSKCQKKKLYGDRKQSRGKCWACFICMRGAEVAVVVYQLRKVRGAIVSESNVAAQCRHD